MKQIGGEHYNCGSEGMEPWDIIRAWNLDYWEGNALKYLLRWRRKGGVQDLEKAKHYIEHLIATAEDRSAGDWGGAGLAVAYHPDEAPF